MKCFTFSLPSVIFFALLSLRACIHTYLPIFKQHYVSLHLIKAEKIWEKYVWGVRGMSYSKDLAMRYKLFFIISRLVPAKTRFQLQLRQMTSDSI